MGILERLLRRRKPVERRWGGYSTLGTPGPYAGLSGRVDVRQSELLSTVVGCKNMIASAIASLPASLETKSGEPVPNSAPAQRILDRAGPLMSWPSAMEWAVGQLLGTGNCVMRVDLDLRGAPMGLSPVPWQWLSPMVVNGRLCFDVTASGPEAELFGLHTGDRLFADDNVMFCKLRSDNGVLGRSPLDRASDVLREGLEVNAIAHAMWRNSMRPSLVMKTPNFLSDTQRKRKQEFVDEYTGALASGRVPLLEGGWDLATLSSSARETELLASRQFSVSEICRLFSVPEQLLQPGDRSVADLAPYTTALAQFALSPLVKLIEDEFSHAMLPPGQRLRLDLDGLQRGSFSAVVAALCALRQSEVITANDARAELGWQPLPDGDTLQRGDAPTWPADGPGSDHLGPSPGPRPANGLAEPGSNENEGNPRRTNGAAHH